MAVEKIQVPDIGDEQEVEVIEILVSPGDEVSENDSLIVLESDKAAMEIPSPKAGVIKEILVKVGAQVSQGTDIVSIEIAGASEDDSKEDDGSKEESVKESENNSASKTEEVVKEESVKEEPAKEETPAPAATGGSYIREVLIPDLGDDSDVDVIDILVAVGDEVKEEDGLVTLETDKAAMDVPSPAAGKVVSIKLKVGDKVSEGSLILELETTGEASAPEKAASAEKPVQEEKPAAQAASAPSKPVETKSSSTESSSAQSSTTQSSTTQSSAGNTSASGNDADVYAGPAVRKLARELGVHLSEVPGSGARGRIVKEDIQSFVKARMQGGTASVASSGGAGLPAIEDIDFSQFGEVEEVELTKLHRLTAQNMTRNWLNVPHVTQFDETDVTDLEDFREAQKALAEKKGIKLTPLPFIVKACAQALKEYPQFNVSLHSSGTKLIQKKYIHIGVAVATPAGLMVPVVKDADQKSIWQIAAEIAELGAKAKDRKLTREDMQGASFTISSLGNIGGTGFTPIVNAPEVAILGVSRTAVKPVYVNGEFVPRKMLPFALSYDHRAVNGVDGGMFCSFLGSLLADIRLLTL